MATSTTVRPDSTRKNDGFQTTTASTSTITSGNANILAALNDTTNDTFIQKPNTGFYEWQGNVANPSAPASTDFVANVTYRVKMSQASTGNITAVLNTGSYQAAYGVISGSVGTSHGRTVTHYQRTGTTAKLTTSAAHGLAVNDQIVVQGVLAALNGAYTVTGVPTSTTVEYTTATSATVAQTATSAGAVVSQVVNKDLVAYAAPGTGTTPAIERVWSSTQLNDIWVQLADSSTSTSQNGRPRIYGLEVIVTTATLPAWSAAPTMSGTTTNTRPTVNLKTYSQADSYAQNGVQVRVFTAAKTDPTVSSDLVWDSGTIDNVSDVQIGTDLTNGTTYYVYARTAADSSGSGSQRAWSAWGSGTATSTVSFTLNISPPTAPTLGTASWNATTQAVTLSATGAAYASGTQVFEFQRSNDSGTTWYPVRGASALTPNGSYVAGVTDYEAARNKTVRYRVRAVGDVSGNLRASAWTVTGSGGSNAAHPVTTVTNGGGWTLRSFTSTALDKEILGARVLTDVVIQQEESVGVFRPLGRTTPLVVHGDLEGHDGQWTIVANGATEWANLIGVINSQKLILCLDPFGTYKYVRVTGRDWTLTGAFNTPRYELRVQYVEVPGDLIGVLGSNDTSTGSGYTSPDVYQGEEI